MIERYIRGEDPRAIAATFNTTTVTLYRILNRESIPLRRTKHHLSESDYDEMCHRYKTGESTTKIAHDFGLLGGHAWSIIKSRIETRDHIESARQFVCDESVFDTVTDDSAYWVGMLITDGCVTGGEKRKESPIVRLGLSASDVAHIERFRAFLKSNHPIHFRNPTGRSFHGGPLAEIRISSSRLAESLEQFGVTRRKSLTALVRFLETNPHFWRGVIDGDGNMYIRKMGKHVSPAIRLVGSPQLTRQFLSFVQIYEPSCRVSIQDKRGGTNVSHVAVAGKRAVRIIRLLYENCPVALDRKKAIADQIIAAYAPTTAPPPLPPAARGRRA